MFVLIGLFFDFCGFISAAYTTLHKLLAVFLYTMNNMNLVLIRHIDNPASTARFFLPCKMTKFRERVFFVSKESRKRPV